MYTKIELIKGKKTDWIERINVNINANAIYWTVCICEYVLDNYSCIRILLCVFTLIHAYSHLFTDNYIFVKWSWISVNKCECAYQNANARINIIP